MTRPTKLQERACDRFAEALGLIAEGARLDGGGRFGEADLGEVVGRLARASSAFGPEQIVARALEGRGRALGHRAGTGELLTLLDGRIAPTAMLLLPDSEFNGLVESMEQELGEA